MADAHIASADLSTLDRGVLEALIAAQPKEMVAKDEALAAQQERLFRAITYLTHSQVSGDDCLCTTYVCSFGTSSATWWPR